MNFQIFGGETLMKWREPNAYVRRDLSHLIPRFGMWIICIVFFIAIFATKLNGQPIKNSFFTFSVVSIFLSVALLAQWFLPGASIRLRELCVQKAQGKSCNRSDYSKIESATILQENYDGQKFSVIQFKLKEKYNPNDKSTWNTTVEKNVVPEDINLEKVLQIFRDKGVNVIEG